MELEVTVDREADAAYIYLTTEPEKQVAPRQVPVRHGGAFALVVDFDAQRRVIGMEIIGAEAGLRPDVLAGATDITSRVTDRDDS